MDAYDTELEKVADALQLLPRKLSESNVRILGNLNHFETFEEDDPSTSKTGKRLSLSGSIVVLDLDFASTNEVHSASVSLSHEASSDAPTSAMAPVNNPSDHLLKALQEPRLDTFKKMLSYLSRCDRFSTKSVDCFRGLDLISESIHWYVNKTGSQEFGKLCVNPPKRLGLGFLYNELYSGSQYAYLDVVPGSRPEFCVRSFNQIDDWLDTNAVAWKTELPVPEYEARAELALTLDPPVIVSDTMAANLSAIISDSAPRLNERKLAASFTVRRHPRFASETSPDDDFDVYYGNLLPFKLVKISHIPISGPARIPPVLSALRRFSTAVSLAQSMLNGPEPAWTNEAVDLNIADALALKDQPVHRRRIPLSVSLSAWDRLLIVNISWMLTDQEVEIQIGEPTKPRIILRPEPPSRLNVDDLERLITRGNLALATSYAVSSLGKLQRRSTIQTR